MADPTEMRTGQTRHGSISPAFGGTRSPSAAVEPCGDLDPHSAYPLINDARKPDGIFITAGREFALRVFNALDDGEDGRCGGHVGDDLSALECFEEFQRLTFGLNENGRRRICFFAAGTGRN